MILEVGGSVIKVRVFEGRSPAAGSARVVEPLVLLFHGLGRGLKDSWTVKLGRDVTKGCCEDFCACCVPNGFGDESPLGGGTFDGGRHVGGARWLHGEGAEETHAREIVVAKAGVRSWDAQLLDLDEEVCGGVLLGECWVFLDQAGS